MSVLFTEDRAWLVTSWISRGFFEDCLPHLDRAPLLAGDIRFCVDAGVDTLDLRGKGRAEFQELKVLAEQVAHDNEHSGGKNFHSPELFPIYLSKIKELPDCITQVLEERPGERQ
jgi:hypothetical protein